jgi:hypothetical protein
MATQLTPKIAQDLLAIYSSCAEFIETTIKSREKITEKKSEVIMEFLWKENASMGLCNCALSRLDAYIYDCDYIKSLPSFGRNHRLKPNIPQLDSELSEKTRLKQYQESIAVRVKVLQEFIADSELKSN